MVSQPFTGNPVKEVDTKQKPKFWQYLADAFDIVNWGSRQLILSSSQNLVYSGSISKEINLSSLDLLELESHGFASMENEIIYSSDIDSPIIVYEIISNDPDCERYVKINVESGKSMIKITLDSPKSDYPYNAQVRVTTSLKLPLSDHFAPTVKVLGNDISLSSIESASFPKVIADSHIGSITLKKLDSCFIQIKTRVGSVTLSNIKTTEKLQIETTTGSIDAHQIDAAELDFNASVGSISLEHAKVKSTLSLKSSTGSINLDANASEIHLRSSTGSIKGKVSDYNLIEVVCSTGSIALELYPLLGSSNSFESSMGAVKNTLYGFNGIFDASSNMGTVSVSGEDIKFEFSKHGTFNARERGVVGNANDGAVLKSSTNMGENSLMFCK